MSEPLIQLQDITKTFAIDGRSLPVLQGISLRVEQGEFLALLGPSGSGKSTLLHLIGCLDVPTSGSYRFDGKDLSRASERDLTRIRRFNVGFVFQTFNLLRRATVVENIALPLLYQGIHRHERVERVSQAAEKVGISHRIGHRSNQLSGGEQQRVAIARALVMRPRVILADEPTGNLDSKTGEAILALFGALNREGVTVLLVTHDAANAAHAQRQIHLQDGRIVEERR